MARPEIQESCPHLPKRLFCDWCARPVPVVPLSVAEKLATALAFYAPPERGVVGDIPGAVARKALAEFRALYPREETT